MTSAILSRRRAANRRRRDGSGLGRLKGGDAASVERLGEPVRLTLGDDDVGMVQEAVDGRDGAGSVLGVAVAGWLALVGPFIWLHLVFEPPFQDSPAPRCQRYGASWSAGDQTHLEQLLSQKGPQLPSQVRPTLGPIKAAVRKTATSLAGCPSVHTERVKDSECLGSKNHARVPLERDGSFRYQSFK